MHRVAAKKVGLLARGGVGRRQGNDLCHVVGGDFQKFFGVGFFDERPVVAMDDVRGIGGPARGFALVLFVGEVPSREMKSEQVYCVMLETSFSA
jgi:hypothetical protein